MTERCWAATYDLFAHEYGYTLEQFFKLPLRLMNILIERIHARRHNEKAENYEWQAKLNKMKLTIPRVKIVSDTPPPKISAEQTADDKKIEEMLKKRLAEKQVKNG